MVLTFILLMIETDSWQMPRCGHGVFIQKVEKHDLNNKLTLDLQFYIFHSFVEIWSLKTKWRACVVSCVHRKH